MDDDRLPLPAAGSRAATRGRARSPDAARPPRRAPRRAARSSPRPGTGAAPAGSRGSSPAPPPARAAGWAAPAPCARSGARSSRRQALHHERLAAGEVLDVQDGPRHLHARLVGGLAAPRTRRASESVCRWMTPPAARRTSSGSPPASTAHASFDAPPGEQHGLGDRAEHGFERLPHLCDHRRCAATGASRCARSWRSTSIRTSARSPARTTRPTRSSPSCSRRRRTPASGRRTCRPRRAARGSGFLEYAHLNEEIGRSFIAQLIFGCQAPDAGNAEILHLYGTPEQKERFLAAARGRRDPLLLRHDRAGGGRLRPDASARPRGARRRRVGDRRAQVVLVGRRRRRVRRS